MYMELYIYIVGAVPLRKTAEMVEKSVMFCAFYLIKMSFYLHFSVLYIYMCVTFCVAACKLTYDDIRSTFIG